MKTVLTIEEQALYSIGCVEFGNNNFYEVLRYNERTLFSPHDGVGDQLLSYDEFFSEVPVQSLSEVFEQLSELFSNNISTVGGV